VTTAPDATDLRQAAIDAADKALWETAETPDITDLSVTPAMTLIAGTAVTAAFATLAEGLCIAPDEYSGETCIWADHDGENPELLAAKANTSPRLWALLAAVIPTRNNGQETVPARPPDVP
jgi:hypothetical protein